MPLLFPAIITLVSVSLGVEAGFDNKTAETAFIQSKIDQTTSNSPHGLMLNNTVFLYLDIYQLVDVEEKLGLINLKLWIYKYYYLPHIAWDPDAIGVSAFSAKMGTFWNPDVVPYDVSEIVYSAFNEQIVMANGVVAAMSSLFNVKISCAFDIYYFPFDQQVCRFSMGQWVSGNDSYHVNFEEAFTTNGEISLDYYAESDQWKLIRPLTIEHGVRAWKNFGFYEMVIYTVRLERRPEFFLFVLTIPTIILVIISALTFVLPVDSGEKVSLGITILLSQIVGLLVLSDILPPSSQYFPILGYYVLASILLISISIVASVFGTHYSFMKHFSCFNKLRSLDHIPVVN